MIVAFGDFLRKQVQDDIYYFGRSNGLVVLSLMTDNMAKPPKSIAMCLLTRKM
jgi:hypothetical protein